MQFDEMSYVMAQFSEFRLVFIENRNNISLNFRQNLQVSVRILDNAIE